MSPENTLADLLAALSRVMAECCERWYLFGAQAVQVWGAPRLTADVDVTVQLRVEDFADFVARMQKEGFVAPMLLNELQKQHRMIQEQRRTIEEEMEQIKDLAAQVLRLDCPAR